MTSLPVPAEDDVDRLLAAARQAGATITRPAERGQWGGWFGYFADPDGHLWKVVAGSN